MPASRTEAEKCLDPAVERRSLPFAIGRMAIEASRPIVGRVLLLIASRAFAGIRRAPEQEAKPTKEPQEMPRQLTEREAFANVLGVLVLQRCIAAKSQRTSRTGLQAAVPVGERPYVRRGFDALIEHGMLVMSGEDIGFTSRGNAFLTYVANVEDHSPTLEADLQGHPVLTPLLAAIAVDDRLLPPKPMEEIATLPARLEDRPARSGVSAGRWALLMGAATVAAGAAFALLR